MDASQIDEYIFVELPDPIKDPRGYKVVSELMLHGPCGAANLSAPCKQNGTYNKKFPKRFNANTFFDRNGHIQYRRRYTGTHFMKHESRLDNCNVVLSIGEPSTSVSANNKKIDEIQNYIAGRFICPYEACWRIFDFSINSQEPAVKILNVHLEDKQRVTFSDRERVDTTVNIPERKKTTLTEWFVYNNENIDGRNLTYLNFPSEFVWYADSKRWQRRQITTKKLLGRLAYVHPSSAKHWESMQDDIPMKISKSTGILNYHVNTPELQGCILYELEAILNGFGKCVRDFRLQPPPEHLLKDLENKLLMEDKNYNKELLMQDAIRSVPKLNCEQKKIYDLIMNAFIRNKQDLLFVYGHGGTGKTFLWKTIISSLRSQGKIVLATTSSGIASLLLLAGRTAHSRFKLPLELTNESLCHVKKNTQLRKLTLRDLMSSPDLIFGGKTVVLGGDFRQTLRVKKGSGKQELITASVAESHLWWHFKICLLNINMRLLRSDLNDEQQQRVEVFAKRLLNIGNGETGEPDNEDDQESSEALQEKAIVCQKNDTADAVNAKILSLIEGHGKTYLSKDEATPMGKETSETKLLYLIEYLNTISFPDYLGCIRSISDITPFGDANSGQGWLRKVDIENLDGNVVEFTMWDVLAKLFNKEEIEKLSPPIIIVVSSCRVSKYRATFATYYYINPQTPEAEYAYTEEYTLHVKLQSHLLQKIEAGTIHPVASATKNQRK
ncbi:DNA helicase [Tanacetum coccineum]